MLTRYAALEDEYRIGGAYWVWKQACGDPQNGIQDIGDGLMIQDCATGDFSGTNDALLEILGRAYPRSAPGEITSLSADGSTYLDHGHRTRRNVWARGVDSRHVRRGGIHGRGHNDSRDHGS